MGGDITLTESIEEKVEQVHRRYLTDHEKQVLAQFDQIELTERETWRLEYMLEHHDRDVFAPIVPIIELFTQIEAPSLRERYFNLVLDHNELCEDRKFLHQEDNLEKYQKEIMLFSNNLLKLVTQLDEQNASMILDWIEPSEIIQDPYLRRYFILKQDQEEFDVLAESLSKLETADLRRWILTMEHLGPLGTINDWNSSARASSPFAQFLVKEDGEYRVSYKNQEMYLISLEKIATDIGDSAINQVAVGLGKILIEGVSDEMMQTYLDLIYELHELGEIEFKSGERKIMLNKFTGSGLFYHGFVEYVATFLPDLMINLGQQEVKSYIDAIRRTSTFIADTKDDEIMSIFGQTKGPKFVHNLSLLYSNELDYTQFQQDLESSLAEGDYGKAFLITNFLPYLIKNFSEEVQQEFKSILNDYSQEICTVVTGLERKDDKDSTTLFLSNIELNNFLAEMLNGIEDEELSEQMLSLRITRNLLAVTEGSAEDRTSKFDDIYDKSFFPNRDLFPPPHVSKDDYMEVYSSLKESLAFRTMSKQALDFSLSLLEDNTTQDHYSPVQIKYFAEKISESYESLTVPGFLRGKDSGFHRTLKTLTRDETKYVGFMGFLRELSDTNKEIIKPIMDHSLELMQMPNKDRELVTAQLIQAGQVIDSHWDSILKFYFGQIIKSDIGEANLYLEDLTQYVKEDESRMWAVDGFHRENRLWDFYN